MRLAPALCLLLSPLPAVTPAFAEAWPVPVTAVIDTARAECAAFEGGTLAVGAQAVQQVDLTGDGAANWVVDTHGLDCSSAASLYCGTGGCALDLIVDGTVTETLSKGWRVLEMGPLRVVLLQVHGSDCGGTNLTPCVEARVWDAVEGRFTSLRPAR